MPTSHPYQLDDLVGLVMIAAPESVLDVGVGFGKLGMLCREYLEVWDGRLAPAAWQVRVDGIESFPQYLQPWHDAFYDQIHVGDALEVLARLERRYDLVLLVDIVEHFELERGRELIRQSLDVGRTVLVSTPRLPAEQGAAFGNPDERHRSRWRRRDLRALGPVAFIPNWRSILAVLGPEAHRIRRQYWFERLDGWTAHRKRRYQLARWWRNRPG